MRTPAAAKRAVEIRGCAPRPGTREDFHLPMSEQAVPMLRRWNVDEVAHGPSPHDADGYCLVRAWRDLAGREAIPAASERCTDGVLPLDEAAMAALRGALPG